MRGADITGIGAMAASIFVARTLSSHRSLQLVIPSESKIADRAPKPFD
jgi:hypothetical protein